MCDYGVEEKKERMCRRKIIKTTTIT